MIWSGIFILCIISLAGHANGRTAIIKGRDANIADFPHQASFREDKINKHKCGGAIISEKHVVTAGHCVEELSYRTSFSGYVIVTGTSFLKDDHGQRHKISRVYLHPKFYDNGNRAENDIAMIKLKKPIVFDIHQNKINLPSHDYQVGAKGFVAGWGLIQQDPEVLPDRLQKLEVKIMSAEECQEKVINPKLTKILDTEICAVRQKGAGVCLYDSGGPLTINGEFAGIISWSDGDDCASKHPDVYTNVFKQKRFIEDVLNYDNKH